MSLEIERRWLVPVDKAIDICRGEPTAILFEQFYIADRNKLTCRVRISDDEASLAIKGMKTEHGVGPEYECDVPIEVADQMRPLAIGKTIKKIRHLIPYAPGQYVELDLFFDVNMEYYLAIAEVEFTNEYKSMMFRPLEWFGDEITDDQSLSNCALAMED